MIPLLLGISLHTSFIEISLAIGLTAVIFSIILCWVALVLKRLYVFSVGMRFLRPLGLILFFGLSLQNTQLSQAALQGIALVPTVSLFWLNPMLGLPDHWYEQTRELGARWWGRIRWFWWPLLKMPTLSALGLVALFSLLQ